MNLRILFSLFLLLTSSLYADTVSQHCCATKPTPVFSTADIQSIFGGENGESLRRDHRRFIAELEFVALPGTCFTIEAIIPQAAHAIYQVSTDDYPSKNPLFIDSRFVKPLNHHTNLIKTVPSVEVILDRLKNLERTPYVWGGNWSEGIPEMLEFYPSSRNLTEEEEISWTLHGVDCSGLLYEVTYGYTPRNTSDLVFFGQAVPIAGKGVDQIISELKPLDLIAWKGHVLIVLDREHLIESRELKGVVITPIHDRLQEILKDRTPADTWHKSTDFVIRQWN